MRYASEHNVALMNMPADPSREWDLRNQIEGFRSKFDLDHDLGGMSVAKVWGIASYRDWVVAIFTVHPTDMVEYITASQERSRLVFAPPTTLDGQTESGSRMPWKISQVDNSTNREAQNRILRFILAESNNQQMSNDPWLRKVQYAALCCVIVSQAQDTFLLSRAKSILLTISNSVEENFVEENALLAKLGPEFSSHDDVEIQPRSIPPKSQQISNSIFEFCDICGSGIEWYSPEESQCAGGHLFGTLIPA